MDFLSALSANLLSPAVLFFALGLIAAVLRSDLKFPEALYVTLTIYLLTALGFKGGVAINDAGIATVLLPALAAMALGAMIPLWVYPPAPLWRKIPARRCRCDCGPLWFGERRDVYRRHQLPEGHRCAL